MSAYYIHDGKNHHGPFNLEELRSRQINRQTPVWTEGLGDWSTAGEIPDLLPLLGAVPPPFAGISRSVTVQLPNYDQNRYWPQTLKDSVDHPQPAIEHTEAIVSTEYDQELYQMELEEFFDGEKTRRRNRLILVTGIFLALAVVAWFFLKD